MTNDTRTLEDLLEEADGKLRALGTVVDLLGVGMAGFGDRTVCGDVMSHLKDSLEDIRATLDEIGSTAMEKASA